MVRAIVTRIPAARTPKNASLWTGSPILNMSINARAEALLPRKSDSLVFCTYFVTNQFTYNLSRFRKIPFLCHILPYLVLIWACLCYDRFHFYCDQGILPPLRHREFNEAELCLYRLLGKQVVFWTYGADVRTRQTTQDLGDPNCCTQCPAPGTFCICDEERGRENQRVLRQYGPIFSMGDMIEYTPQSRNDLFFWPVDLAAEEGQRYRAVYPNPTTGTPVRIVHAPNHRHFKGTDFLLRAVNELKAEGVPVELRLVERIPNQEALDVYRTADIIFDQCLIGYHGYFANEAMAMGKPVICFIREPQSYLFHASECPIISARPEELKSVLRELIVHRERLRELGMAGRKYIEAYYSLQSFSQRLRQAYFDLGWRIVE